MGVDTLTDERIRILCVDDEASVLRALERTLTDEGYEIVSAATGKAALEILAACEEPVQIVISDYRMPEMDGVELLREVRQRWPETERIVLSGHADVAAIVAAVNEGEIYRFVAKPWHEEELKIAIMNAAERYRLNRENRRLSEELQTTNVELRRVNYNLERVVAEKVSKVAFQNRFFSLAHEVLDLLPVAVVALDANGSPFDGDLDGAADYWEDRNGNGSVDSGETDWNSYLDTGLVVRITEPKKTSNVP